MSHISIGNLTSIGSDNSPAQLHYLNLCWNIVNWTLRNRFQWNVNQNSNIFIEENMFENVICRWWPFCLGPNVLNHQSLDGHHTEWVVANFKTIFLNENIWVLLQILLNIMKFDYFHDKSALVYMMAWCWICNKPQSQPMRKHICH